MSICLGVLTWRRAKGWLPCDTCLDTWLGDTSPGMLPDAHNDTHTWIYIYTYIYIFIWISCIILPDIRLQDVWADSHLKFDRHIRWHKADVLTNTRLDMSPAMHACVLTCTLTHVLTYCQTAVCRNICTDTCHSFLQTSLQKWTEICWFTDWHVWTCIQACRVINVWDITRHLFYVRGYVLAHVWHVDWHISKKNILASGWLLAWTHVFTCLIYLQTKVLK